MRFKIILLLLLLFLCGYRSPKPARITDFDERGLVIQNEVNEQLWNVLNGRFSLDITIVNPDGARQGDVGDMILLNDSGTYYLCINVGGIVWRSVQLSDTP